MFHPKSLSAALLAFVFVVQTVGAANEQVAPDRPGEMLAASLAYAETMWDESVGLLHSPDADEPGLHRVRESTWYALGLLSRAAPGDETRAIRIIDEVLRKQFNAPGQPWDGTFARAPEEPLPQPGAVLWKNFDPNWRQFIGTTFVLMLEEFSPRLPVGLRTRMLEAIQRAVEGELTQGRAEPYHTNIELMHGFLLGWAGVRFHRPEWIAQSEASAEKIRAAFAEHLTFEEYNSPTYYGVDLYGLSLWRRLGATQKIRAYGAELEAGLWRDIAQFYHAGLRNLCGPFDRAYGLDQRKYVSLVGIWMGLVLERELAPFPDPRGRMEHAHDFFCAPTYVVLGANIPPDLLPALRTFQGERQLERVITPERTATAWLGQQIMLGGEITRKTREAGPGTRFGQFHPATAHWRIGEQEVGAFALRVCPAVDARAEPNHLNITTAKGLSTFRLSVPGAKLAHLGKEHWSLPGLDVKIETDAVAFSVVEGDGYFDVTYTDATRFDVRVAHRP